MVIPIGIWSDLSCLIVRRRLFWYSVRYFRQCCILYVAFSWAFVFLFLASDWDRTGKGSLSKDGWFPHRPTKHNCLFYFSAGPEGKISRHMLLLFFFLWSSERRKKISSRSWRENKRSCFNRAMKQQTWHRLQCRLQQQLPETQCWYLHLVGGTPVSRITASSSSTKNTDLQCQMTPGIKPQQPTDACHLWRYSNPLSLKTLHSACEM